MPAARHPAKRIEDPDFGVLRCTYDGEIGAQWAHLHAGPGRPPASIGELWETRERLAFLGVPHALALEVHTADWPEVLAGRRREGEITARQRAALAWMRADLPTIEAAIRSALVQHYHDCLRLIEYGHADFAPVASCAPLLPLCRAWTASFPWQDGEDPLTVAVQCRCAWEDEHGFTATFVDGCLSAVE